MAGIDWPSWPFGQAPVWPQVTITPTPTDINISALSMQVGELREEIKQLTTEVERLQGMVKRMAAKK